MRTGSALAALLLAGCGGAGSPSPFEPRLREIAAEYRKYGRVDDETRWAPELCRMPFPSRARFSASANDETHGRKLYYVFAADRFAYWDVSKPQPPGQVLVKEAWLPEEVADQGQGRETENGRLRGTKREPGVGIHLPFARKDGRLYRTERMAGLYIMFKTEPATPGTDQGWVYGTVTADGGQVTSSGRVASCMSCHTRATGNRLFGIGKVEY